MSIIYSLSIHFSSSIGKNIAFALGFVFVSKWFSCNKNINIQSIDIVKMAAFKNQMVNRRVGRNMLNNENTCEGVFLLSKF